MTNKADNWTDPTWYTKKYRSILEIKTDEELIEELHYITVIETKDIVPGYEDELREEMERRGIS